MVIYSTQIYNQFLDSSLKSKKAKKPKKQESKKNWSKQGSSHKEIQAQINISPFSSHGCMGRRDDSTESVTRQVTLTTCSFPAYCPHIFHIPTTHRFDGTAHGYHFSML